MLNKILSLQFYIVYLHEQNKLISLNRCSLVIYKFFSDLLYHKLGTHCMMFLVFLIVACQTVRYDPSKILGKSHGTLWHHLPFIRLINIISKSLVLIDLLTAHTKSVSVWLWLIISRLSIIYYKWRVVWELLYVKFQSKRVIFRSYSSFTRVEIFELLWLNCMQPHVRITNIALKCYSSKMLF